MTAPEAVTVKAAADGGHRIDRLAAPLFVSWQLTRNCDLACVHCCTESAPGKALTDELDRDEALRLADEIVAAQVPYVMLCGGEPMVVPHALEIAERLGAAGTQLKIETNGQRFDAETAAILARLPVRSVQISLDAGRPETYARQRPGASLAKVHAACRAVREAGLPLEVTFAPTRLNIEELPAVIERARAIGAFRLNTGRLMRLGNAAKHWSKLVPSAAQYEVFHATLEREAANGEGGMELCFTPFRMEDALARTLQDPPATLLVLPNGWVKVAAALPLVCADLRRQPLPAAWERYCRAWHTEEVASAAQRAIMDDTVHADANRWRSLAVSGT